MKCSTVFPIRLLIGGLVLAGSAFYGAALASVPTVADPDFSAATIAGGHQDFVSGLMGSWTVTVPEVQLYAAQNDLGFTVPQGQSRAVFLSAGRLDYTGISITVPGKISQTISDFEPGQEYRLAFNLGVFPGSGWATVQVGIDYLDTGQVFRITRQASTTQPWAPASVDFALPLTAGTTATISFSGPTIIGQAPGIAIAGPVTLTAIPEPSHYGLMGLVGMLALATRKSFRRMQLR